MYRGLDSLRALAFLAVFAYHCHFLPFGYLGVQAFFVLSGFLLTPILVDMREQLDARHFFINFYGRRFLRIFPIYYLYVFSVLLIGLVVVNSKTYPGIEVLDRFLAQLPWTLTYTYNFFHASYFFQFTPFVTHFWSLAVEEQFYLIWPAIIWAVHPKQLRLVLLALSGLGPFLRLLGVMLYESGQVPFLNPQLDWVIYSLPFSYIDAFALGGYFALYQKSDPTNLPTLGLVYGSILAGYVSQYIAMGQIDIPSLGYRPFLKDQVVWGYSLISLVSAKTILQIRDGRFSPWIVNNRFLNYLGKISYGMYIIHNSIIWLVAYIFPALTIFAGVLTSLLATIGLSAMVYEGYEKRFLNLKDKFFPKTMPP